MPPKASTQLVFQDPTEVGFLIKRVRSDTDDLAWVIFTYAQGSDNVLEVSGNGVGGLDEFKSHFSPSSRSYGLLRVVDIFDGYTTIKFIFVAWAGTNVGVISKAKMTTHKGSIVELIGQAHISIDASEPEDIAAVMVRVADASGSGNRVVDIPRNEEDHRPAPAAYNPPPAQAAAPVAQKPATEPRAQPKTQPKFAASVHTAPGVPKTGASASELSFADRDAGTAAINRVRKDDDPADWVLFGYQGESNVVDLVGVGEGGIEALKSQLQPESINYGLVRVYDFYDGHRTTKFVLILWVGERVKIMRKARITTHKGAVVEFIGQHHTDISCANLGEINEEIIMTAVKNASGTAVHVK